MIIIKYGLLGPTDFSTKNKIKAFDRCFFIPTSFHRNKKGKFKSGKWLRKDSVPGKSTDSSEAKVLIGEITPDRRIHASTRHVLRVSGR